MSEHTDPQDNVSPDQPQNKGQSTPQTKTFTRVVLAIDGRVKGDYSLERWGDGYIAKVTVFAVGTDWTLIKMSHDRSALESAFQAVVEAGGVSASGSLFVFRDLDPDPAAWVLQVEVTTLTPVVLPVQEVGKCQSMWQRLC